MEKTKAVIQNTYEAMFLLGSGFATDIEGATKLVRGIVEKHEGQVIVIKKWDERKLAYEIAGQKRGLFVICFFKGPGPAIAAIERDVDLSDQVLRVLVTRADHLNAEEMAAVEPQPIQPREERNPWDRPWYDEKSGGGRDGGGRDGGFGGGGGRDGGSRDGGPPRGRGRHEDSAEAAMAKD